MTPTQQNLHNDVGPVKDQISLCIQTVGSVFARPSNGIAKDLIILLLDREDSDQTGPMRRLTKVLAVCTSFCRFCYAQTQMQLFSSNFPLPVW